MDNELRLAIDLTPNLPRFSVPRARQGRNNPVTMSSKSVPNQVIGEDKDGIAKQLNDVLFLAIMQTISAFVCICRRVGLPLLATRAPFFCKKGVICGRPAAVVFKHLCVSRI